MGKSLAEVAAEHGWTLNIVGLWGAQRFEFTKGKLGLSFSRLTRNTFHVTWAGFSAFHRTFAWPPNESREDYAARLLPLVTEAGAIERVRVYLMSRVEIARRDLAKAEGDLTSFFEHLNG